MKDIDINAPISQRLHFKFSPECTNLSKTKDMTETESTEITRKQYAGILARESKAYAEHIANFSIIAIDKKQRKQ